MNRSDEIRANLATVRARIAAAARSAGRDPADVTLVVITKTWPAADVRILADLGVTDVGENRDQEAEPKAAACADLALTWHFVGQIQRNKAARIVRYSDVLHSVDRVPLVAVLDSAAARHGRLPRVFVQVDLGEGADAGRGGALPTEVPEVCAAVDSAQHLDLIGLMAVAPLGADPAVAFDRLAGVRATVLKDFPAAGQLSAGMSGDLEQAVAAGATHVRVGSAVLGVRQTVR